jgi:hypothetical protein
MWQADDFFRREAEEATRQNPEWDYSKVMGEGVKGFLVSIYDTILSCLFLLSGHLLHVHVLYW